MNDNVELRDKHGASFDEAVRARALAHTEHYSMRRSLAAAAAAAAAAAEQGSVSDFSI